MCGITGLVHFDPHHPIEPALLGEMTYCLRHRGPDDQGYFIDENVGLGHRRLSVIDLTSGHQPIGNEEGTVWIVYNGEIYNYLELRRELISREHQFRTNSDTEVIVHGYEEFGEACLERLNGMFAFAIYDRRRGERRLFLARDRFGIKPLYFLQTRPNSASRRRSKHYCCTRLFARASMWQDSPTTSRSNSAWATRRCSKASSDSRRGIFFGSTSNARLPRSKRNGTGRSTLRLTHITPKIISLIVSSGCCKMPSVCN